MLERPSPAALDLSSGSTPLVLSRLSSATLDNDNNNSAAYAVIVFPYHFTCKRMTPNLRDGSSLIAEARGYYATPIHGGKGLCTRVSRMRKLSLPGSVRFHVLDLPSMRPLHHGDYIWEFFQPRDPGGKV